MWLMMSIGVTLAYLRIFHISESVMGLAAVAIGLFVGSSAGIAYGRVGSSTYWALVGALSAFLCAVGQPIYHPSFLFGWMLVGASAGAISAVLGPSKPLRSILIASLAGVGILSGFVFGFVGLVAEALLEVACAGIAGGLLSAVVQVTYWLERRGDLPRYVSTTGLLLAVIVGNLVARFLIPGW